MSSPDDGNGRVSFSVKELLAKLDAKMDLFAVGLDAKANIEDMRQVKARLDILEAKADDAAAVDAYRKSAETQRKADRKWLIALALTTCVGVLAIAANVIYTFIK